MMYLLRMVISELRQYKPYIVAEVEIYDDDIDEAQNRGLNFC